MPFLSLRCSTYLSIVFTFGCSILSFFCFVCAFIFSKFAIEPQFFPLYWPAAFLLSKLRRFSFCKILSILHCAVAAPTLAVSPACLMRVRPLSPIDLANFVEKSSSDSLCLRLCLINVFRHSLIILVHFYNILTWHFLLVTYFVSCY